MLRTKTVSFAFDTLLPGKLMSFDCSLASCTILWIWLLSTIYVYPPRLQLVCSNFATKVWLCTTLSSSDQSGYMSDKRKEQSIGHGGLSFSSGALRPAPKKCGPYTMPRYSRRTEHTTAAAIGVLFSFGGRDNSREWTRELGSGVSPVWTQEAMTEN